MNKKLLLLFLLVSMTCVSQKDTKYIFGTLYDELGTLPGAHVINLTSKKATYSNDNGSFKLKVSLKDSIKITSVGFKTLKFSVENIHFSIEENKFILKKEVLELDEIELKKNNLIGSLSSDLKQTPTDKRADALAKTMDFSKINMKAATKDDHIDNYVRPPKAETDPTQQFATAGASVGMPFKHSERLWALRRKLAFKESFPSKLISDFGEDFFFKDLNIPIEKYHHFLEYCNPLGIEDLYQKGKILEVIKILRKEHTSYLKIIKKE